MVIPDSVIHFDWGFLFCSNLKSFIIPECIKKIGSHAFYQCSSLKYVTIPKSIQHIDKTAFDACGQLDYIITDNTSEKNRVISLLPETVVAKVITQSEHDQKQE